MYNETYVRLLPRDARHLFSFWEIAKNDEKNLRTSRPAIARKKTEPVLRVYEVAKIDEGDTRETAVRDIPVESSNGSGYFPVSESGGTYRIDLGLKSHSGSFEPLCASTPVTLPTAAVRQEPAATRRAQQAADALLERSLGGAIARKCGTNAAMSTDHFPLSSGSPVRPFSASDGDRTTDIPRA